MRKNLSALLETLKIQFTERVLTSQAAREHHGSSESHLPSARPDAVVMAYSTQEVSDVLRAFTQHGVPVIPFGARSSL
jgi:D-lactate dehydrogenase (cytochrome)